MLCRIEIDQIGRTKNAGVYPDPTSHLSTIISGSVIDMDTLSGQAPVELLLQGCWRRFEHQASTQVWESSGRSRYLPGSAFMVSLELLYLTDSPT